MTSPTDGRDQTLMVCKDWAESEFGVNPILVGPSARFESCALLKSSPCLDFQGNAIGDRDRYMCGDDPVYPSSYAYTNDNGEIDTTLSIEGFMNADDMGPPVLNENYYFKLVSNAECDEAYLDTLYENLDTAAKEQPQPNCLRSAAQLTETTHTFGSLTPKQSFRDYFCLTTTDQVCGDVSCDDGEARAANPCCCADWHGELCFGAAMSAFAPSPFFFAVAAALMLLLV
jgi:hypothetical protein